MLPMGRLADVVDRKRVYTSGFGLFAAGGALAGLSPSLGTVIAMKMIQGAGTAMVQSTSMAIVTSTFLAEERATGNTFLGCAGWAALRRPPPSHSAGAVANCTNCVILLATSGR